MKNHNLRNFFYKKKVFVTGHTGFKGTWLTSCLINFGAEVLGYSKYDNHINDYKKTCDYSKVKNIYSDILNFNYLKKIILNFKPQIIFHLAAQSLVSKSYLEPYNTITTNVIGTINVIEISRLVPSLKSLVLITSDKCYLNKEIKKGYNENDILGGEDPYSASKASAEILFNAYSKSFLNKQNKFGYATVRAGNVIGGGDWSENRIIPDCIRSIINKKKLFIRNPNSTRPWQHVLEPVSGYMLLAKKLFEKNKKFAGSWNFGPSNKEIMKVSAVVEMFFRFLNIKKKISITKGKFKEANLLKLNSTKAKKKINWNNRWNMKESIRQTALWYKKFIEKKDIKSFTNVQIFEYFKND